MADRALNAGRFRARSVQEGATYLRNSGFQPYKQTHKGLVWTQVHPGSDGRPPSLVALLTGRAIISFHYSLRDCGCDG